MVAQKLSWNYLLELYYNTMFRGISRVCLELLLKKKKLCDGCRRAERMNEEDFVFCLKVETRRVIFRRKVCRGLDLTNF